jgi:hypothetical protein
LYGIELSPLELQPADLSASGASFLICSSSQQKFSWSPLSRGLPTSGPDGMWMPGHHDQP